MTAMLEQPHLGEGAYTFTEAARILRGAARPVTTRQLRYWMTTGLAPATHRDVEDDEPILNFDDLVTLEIVRRLRQEGASLQGIRQVESALREAHPAYQRPFAYEVFFTDGADVWAEVVGGDKRLVIELTGRRKNQFAWRDAILTFAKDIRFEGKDRHAIRWRLSQWVEIDPQIQYGMPVAAGSRVPLRTIAANLEVGTPEQVADWFGLSVEQVEGVRDYLAFH